MCGQKKKKKPREPFGVKTNTALGFRVHTSAIDPFLVGCVNDTQGSQRVPLNRNVELRLKNEKKFKSRNKEKKPQGTSALVYQIKRFVLCH